MITLLAGLAASFLHVISGPDHLAAVTPLAIESRKEAWKIGFSWGIGHTLGALLIGLVYIFFRQFIHVEVISSHSEKIVGFILIVIGLWAIWNVAGNTSGESHKHPHLHFEQTPYIHSHPHPHNPEFKGSRIIARHDHFGAGAHSHVHEKPVKQNIFAALSVGTLHGFAGVSHLIAILPTLAFATTFQSALYLTGFGIGTLTAMILYSTFLGYLAHKSQKVRTGSLYRNIRLAGGGIAILTGIFWIAFSFNI